MKSKLTNPQAADDLGSHETTNLSRRGFMMTTALAAAGAGAAGSRRVSSVATGTEFLYRRPLRWRSLRSTP
jgi:hypothetical protein